MLLSAKKTEKKRTGTSVGEKEMDRGNLSMCVKRQAGSSSGSGMGEAGVEAGVAAMEKDKGDLQILVADLADGQWDRRLCSPGLGNQERAILTQPLIYLANGLQACSICQVLMTQRIAEEAKQSRQSH